jgi:hypothetical protein
MHYSLSVQHDRITVVISWFGPNIMVCSQGDPALLCSKYGNLGYLDKRKVPMAKVNHLIDHDPMCSKFPPKTTQRERLFYL